MLVCLGFTGLVAGCRSTPKALPPPQIHVAKEFLKNAQPPASLAVPGYAKVYDRSERGRLSASQRAALEATYLAKMAARLNGLRFTRIDELMAYEDRLKAKNFAVSKPDIQHDEAIAVATAVRTADVVAKMAELDLVQVDVSVSHPTPKRMSEAIQESLWQGIRKFAVDKYGLVNPVDLERAITPDTLLVTLLHANNEVGTVQPIAELAEIAHRHGALMHTDAAQSVGKMPVKADTLGVDLLSVAGHKLYAPKGIGALYIRSGVQLVKILHGAGQEGGRRPGTENVLEIVGLGQACQVANRDLDKNRAHFWAMRDRLHEGLLHKLGDGMVRLNGHPEKRLPNTLSLSFRDVEANRLLSEIGEQVAASAGSACHADQVDMSSVLKAMEVEVEWGMGTVRFSVGRSTTTEEVERAVGIVTEAVRRLQS